jgi:predicted transcriptional regulator
MIEPASIPIEFNHMSDRVLTTHVPGELAREVDALAARLDRPRGWVMKHALALFIELEKKRHQLTLEGLADVDAGRTVDHAEIEAWARKLPAKRRRSR